MNELQKIVEEMRDQAHASNLNYVASGLCRWADRLAAIAEQEPVAKVVEANSGALAAVHLAKAGCVRIGDLLYTEPRPPAEGWRPIESAPMDGRWLMLWERYSDAPLIGRYSEASGHWHASKEHVDAEGGWDGAILVDNFTESDLTHWAPLPEPPA